MARSPRLPAQPNAAAYGDAIADIYDDVHADMGDVAEAVTVLSGLAAGGRALELGVGTGRLAIPLAARGVPVHGIDVSPKMLAALRAKPGAEAVDVTLADFADVEVGGPFGLIYVCFNTFFGLTTLDAQQRCFHRVAAHLAPGGHFLVEAFVPPHGAPEAESLRVSTTELFFRRGAVRMVPTELRCATVAELDLMACLAGMRLADRWSSWRKTPFGRGSGNHISTYAVRS
jgi:SAM-dependent methyltransferase